MEKEAPQSSPLPPPGDPARPVLEQEQLQELQGMPGENGSTLLDELVTILVRDVPPDLARLRSLVEKRASADAAQLAHRLSGSAAGLGAAALRQRLHQVEHATRQGNWPAADAACVELEPEWQLTRAALVQATTRPLS